MSEQAAFTKLAIVTALGFGLILGYAASKAESGFSQDANDLLRA